MDQKIINKIIDHWVGNLSNPKPFDLDQAIRYLDVIFPPHEHERGHHRTYMFVDSPIAAQILANEIAQSHNGFPIRADTRNHSIGRALLFEDEMFNRYVDMGYRRPFQWQKMIEPLRRVINQLLANVDEHTIELARHGYATDFHERSGYNCPIQLYKNMQEVHKDRHRWIFIHTDTVKYSRGDLMYMAGTAITNQYAVNSRGGIRDYLLGALYDVDHEFNDHLKTYYRGVYGQISDCIACGIYGTISMGNGVYVVCRMPMYMTFDERGRLHSPERAAVQWFDGARMYSIKGRRMPSYIFERTITKEMFMDTGLSSDIRGGMFEIVEHNNKGAIMKLLGATIVDTQIITHKNKETETLTLYKTAETFQSETDLNGKSDVPLAWLEVVCPSTSAHYLIATDSSFDNAVDSAKYHRPPFVPIDVPYLWNSRN